MLPAATTGTAIAKNPAVQWDMGVLLCAHESMSRQAGITHRYDATRGTAMASRSRRAEWPAGGVGLPARWSSRDSLRAL